MIAIDTNILVYAHREDSKFFQAADARITQLAESGTRFAIPWPCLHEFLAIVTHPKIYNPPTPVSKALDQVACWMEIPGLLLLGEADGYWPKLRQLIVSGTIAGPRVHDARIAALCQSHQVEVLWSADRDFSRFPGLKVENPLK